MDFIGLIIFVIISIVFNNLKNKNQQKTINKNDPNEETVQTYEEYEQEYQRSEVNEALRELTESFRSMEEKIPEKLRGLTSKREYMSSTGSNYQDRKNKRDKKLEEQRAINKETKKKKSRLIPEDHQSGEGRSANPDYIRKDPIQETTIESTSIEKSDIQNIDDIIKGEDKIYFANAADLKRAILLKEILDKPISLRR